MTNMNRDALVSEIRRQAQSHSGRFVVAIAGPPGAGKSTISEILRDALNGDDQHSAVIVPMDGFHLDNVILDQRNLRKRKGAPQTFDCAGFAALLGRLKTASDEVVIPVFDRELDLARAGASIVSPDDHILLVEGNYLLLDEEPWRQLRAFFDFTIFLDVPQATLEQRLVQRWLDHGYDEAGARERALSNDIPNAQYVVAHSCKADLIVSSNG